MAIVLEVWVAREGKRAELWLVRKRYNRVGETGGGDVDGWGDREYSSME